MRGHGWARVVCGALLVLASASATALERLADAELGQVSGRDGLSITSNVVTNIGSFTYTDTDGNGGALKLSNIQVTGLTATTVDIVARPGLSDVVVMDRPLVLPTHLQATMDWGINVGGMDWSGGSLSVRDLVLTGGGWQWTTQTLGDGFAWGHSLRLDIGALALQPRGRDGLAEQLTLSGIHIGEATADGSAPTQPWRIADVNTQPGSFDIGTEADGTQRVRIGIGWPQGSTQAPVGTLQVDNISFQSDVTGRFNLGSSRIGGMQIQFLDVRLRP